MRWVAVVAMVSACGSHGGSGASAGSSASPAAARLPLPHVEDASAVLTPAGAPPVLVLVDAKGATSLAAGPASWKELAAFDARKRAHPIDMLEGEKLLHEAELLHWTPERTVKELENPSPNDQDLEAARLTESDDPPPPPPEDYPDESGGTGTAMALDDNPRMNPTRPQDPRQAQVHAAGGYGTVGFASLATGWGKPRDAVPYPTRQAQVAGEVVDAKSLAPVQRALVLADPHSSGLAFVHAVELSQGLIGVEHAGGVSALRIQFVNVRDMSVDSAPWTEVRVEPDKLVVEAVPGEPIEVAWAKGALDRAALAHAVETMRAQRKRDPYSPIDVLVGSDIDAQRVIDVLVALELSGVHTIGLGERPAPTSPEAKVRGHRIRDFRVTLLALQGDLDRHPVRLALADPSLATCYDQALVAKPDLAGKLSGEITLDSHGKPTSVKLDGLDATLATCLRDKLKTLAFPAPKGRGAMFSFAVTVAPDRPLP